MVTSRIHNTGTSLIFTSSITKTKPLSQSFLTAIGLWCRDDGRRGRRRHGRRSPGPKRRPWSRRRPAPGRRRRDDGRWGAQHPGRPHDGWRRRRNGRRVQPCPCRARFSSQLPDQVRRAQLILGKQLDWITLSVLDPAAME